MKNFIKFNTTVGKLKHLPRTGWLTRFVPDPETVAAHSWRVALIALEFADEVKAMGADLEKVLKMAICHDLGESIIGDYIHIDCKYANITSKEKYEKEAVAVRALADESGINGIYDIWREFEDRDTIEARIAKDFEIIDMLLQAFQYLQENPEMTDLTEFMEKNETHVKTELGKQLVAEIKTAQDEFLREIACKDNE